MSRVEGLCFDDYFAADTQDQKLFKEESRLRLKECENPAKVDAVAADLIISLIKVKPNAVLALPTGQTPIGMYTILAESRADFSQVKVFNLDEYYPINPNHPASYKRYMQERLFSHANFKNRNVHILNGRAKHVSKECLGYERKITEAGGLDLAVVGVGLNGHIAFNEPGSSSTSRTRLVVLTPETMKANEGDFPEGDVRIQALTMGIGTIMEAKYILLIAKGASKAEALTRTLNGPVNSSCPVSFLRDHRNLMIVCDRAATRFLSPTIPIN